MVVGGLSIFLYAYLDPHLVATRQQYADSRIEDRCSTGLRVVRTGADPRPARYERQEHHGAAGSRPYLHDPRRRTEGPAVNRPTTPGERAAAEARRLATARAARAAEISRRQAAARRRLVLTVVLLLATVGGWVGFGAASSSIALGIAPTVLLGAVLVAGRRAAKIAKRRNAADRAAMARMAPKPAPRSVRPTTADAAGEDRAGQAGESGSDTAATDLGDATATGEAERAAERAVPDEAGDESPATWTPVPVPAPSYTLRPPAPRRDIAPYRAPADAPPAVEATGATAPVTATPAAEPASAQAAGELARPAGTMAHGPAATTERAATGPAATEPAPAGIAGTEQVRSTTDAGEAPGTEPAATASPAAEPAIAAIAAAGLAGSPYAPVADPEPALPARTAGTTPAEGPMERPAAQLDIDSVLARRRALGA